MIGDDVCPSHRVLQQHQEEEEDEEKEEKA